MLMSLKQKEIKLKPRIKLKPPATYTFDVLVFQKCNIMHHIAVKAGNAYPLRFYKWIDWYLKNESVSRSFN